MKTKILQDKALSRGANLFAISSIVLSCFLNSTQHCHASSEEERDVEQGNPSSQSTSSINSIPSSSGSTIVNGDDELGDGQSSIVSKDQPLVEIVVDPKLLVAVPVEEAIENFRKILTCINFIHDPEFREALMLDENPEGLTVAAYQAQLFSKGIEGQEHVQKYLKGLRLQNEGLQKLIPPFQKRFAVQAYQMEQDEKKIKKLKATNRSLEKEVKRLKEEKAAPKLEGNDADLLQGDHRLLEEIQRLTAENARLKLAGNDADLLQGDHRLLEEVQGHTVIELAAIHTDNTNDIESHQEDSQSREITPSVKNEQLSTWGWRWVWRLLGYED